MGNTKSTENTNDKSKTTEKVDFSLDFDYRKDNYLTLRNKIRSLKFNNYKYKKNILDKIDNIYEQTSSGYVEMIKLYALSLKNDPNSFKMVNKDPLSLGYMYYLKTLNPPQFDKTTGKTIISFKLELDYNKYYQKNSLKFKETLLKEMDKKIFLDCGLVKNFSVEKIEKGSIIVILAIAPPFLAIYAVALGVRTWRNHQPGASVINEAWNIITQDVITVKESIQNFFGWIWRGICNITSSITHSIFERPPVFHYNHGDFVRVRNNHNIRGTITHVDVTQRRARYRIRGQGNRFFNHANVERTSNVDQGIQTEIHFDVNQPINNQVDVNAPFNQQLQNLDGGAHVHATGLVDEIPRHQSRHSRGNPRIIWIEDCPCNRRYRCFKC